MKCSHLLVRMGVIVAVGFGSATVLWAAGDHRHEGEVATPLTLNHGKPWSTDAPLRQGMEAIRDQVAAVLPRIHAHEFSATAYTTLAKQVRDHIDFMVQNCKLPPDVDAQAHRVLEWMLAGVHAMQEPANPAQGAVQILQALDSYARHFDHPGWKSIHHGTAADGVATPKE